MLVIENLEILPVSVEHLEITTGVTVLTASSGSGKSRFFRAIADLVVNSGKISLGNIRRENTSAPDWRHLVRYVSAEPAWWGATARAHLSPGEATHSLASRFDLSPNLFDSPIDQLSTGERQRFGLVRSLVDDPPVLLLDEPTAALDETTATKVEAELSKRAKAGCIVFLISHSDTQIARIADRVLTIKNNQVVERL